MIPVSSSSTSATTSTTPAVTYDSQTPLSIGSAERDLSVTHVEAVSWSLVSQTAKEWNELANRKYLAFHGDHFPCFGTRDQAAGDKGSIFLTSKIMTRNIFNDLSSGTKCDEPWDSVLICQDKNSKIQAMALYEKKTNKIAYLATHPDNIRHVVNREVPNPVKGAGTEIILFLARIAVSTNQNIYTRAIDNSVPFYEKLHFTQAPENAGAYDSYDDIKPMKLTVAKIRELVSQQTPPFNRLKM